MKAFSLSWLFKLREKILQTVAERESFSLFWGMKTAESGAAFL